MILTNIAVFMAILCLLLGVVFQKPTINSLLDTLFPFGFFFMGLAGLIMVVRREVDFGIVSLEGPLAVLLGISLSLSGFTLSVILFIGILKSLVSN